jgi:pimeloyl-ACP methyl ester carboxylesterase
MAKLEEGLFAPINGEEQWITIRGADARNPAILFLNGPGAAFSRMAPFFAPWEEDFTLVQWDQPGSGSTYAKNGPPTELTFARLARDGVAVAEFARRRLGLDKLVLLGISGGSSFGLNMIKARPDLFRDYVGTGQIVNWARQEALGYEMALAEARVAGNAAAVAELEKIGAPPYADMMGDFIKSKYVNARTPAEMAVFATLSPAENAALMNPPPDANYIAQDLKQPAMMETAMSAYTAWRPQLWAFDAYALGPKFEVPMHFFQGDRDLYTVTSEVQAYCRWIEAPRKSFELLEGGGHSAIFLREKFLKLLRKHLM